MSQSITRRGSWVIDLLTLPAMDVAQSLTAYESALFRAVPIQEFYKTSRPMVDQLVGHFNRFSLHITAQIVHAPEKCQRDLVKGWIHIAEACEELGNLNAVMEIIAGLNHISVSRLKYIWKVKIHIFFTLKLIVFFRH